MRIDLALVRRIESSAARQAADVAQSMARTSPSCAAATADFDGGAMVACGPGRYVNRGVGLGLGDASPESTLDALERFSVAHGVPAMLEVSPWVSEAFVAELTRRRYGLAWFRNVLVRSVGVTPQRSQAHLIVPVDHQSFAAWAAILGERSPVGSPERTISDEFCVAAHEMSGAHDLLRYGADGERDGDGDGDGGLDPVACGSWLISDGVAWLGGAATRTAHRGRGHQRALIQERIARAGAAGADLFVSTALPDGPSARNLESCGFQLLYTQAVMQAPPRYSSTGSTDDCTALAQSDRGSGGCYVSVAPSGVGRGR